MHYTYNFSTEQEKFAHKIFCALVDNFPKTFFTGGTVRDMLLQKNIFDFDIATEALPKQIIEILQHYKINFDSSHERFGVISVRDKKYSIEMTTLRTEVYNGSRYPKVSFTNNMLQDSMRRDFTLNSLYFQPILKQLSDFHGGIEDIHNRIIRLIELTQIKLEEDPLRIVRGYRFALTLNFSFEVQTKQLLEHNLHLLKNISQKKILMEVKKISSTQLQQTLLQVMHKNT